MNFDEIPTGDVVIAGPSCVPFSRVGKQTSWLDSKSRSFLAVLQCIRSQAVRQGSKLKVFIIENVLGFGDKPKDAECSPAQETIEFLERELGARWFIWCWRVSTMATGLPQARERLYICGRLKSIFRTPCPRRQPSDFQFRMLPLATFLDPTLPSVEGSLTPKMLKTFEWYQSKHSSDPDGTIIVCDLTRSAERVRNPTSRADSVPTLTTKIELFIFQVGTPMYRRFMTGRERLKLQGFLPEPILETISSERDVVFAAGNAMSVPAVGLTLACCLSEML